MTKEDKKLLLLDLGARIFEGVKIKVDDRNYPLEIKYITDELIVTREFSNLPYWIEDIKPYLRPMSSMTEEEEGEFRSYWSDEGPLYTILQRIDWLISHHFDYRGLIEKGLALEAPKGMYD